MRIHQLKRRSLTRLLLVALVMIVVASLGFLYYAHHFQKWPFLPAPVVTAPQNTVNYEAPTTEQTNAGAAIKEQVANAAQDATDTPSTPVSSIPVSFTSIQPGSTVYIRVLIGTVTSTATCTLTMTGPEGKTYSATSGVQALSSSSTCQGFNVPMTSLASGNWKITVTVNDGDAASGSVTEEKTL